MMGNLYYKTLLETLRTLKIYQIIGGCLAYYGNKFALLEILTNGWVSMEFAVDLHSS